MKRCLSAPCLADASRELKKSKSIDKTTEPNGKEYLQLALTRILELQQEIKDGTYITQGRDDLGDTGSDEEILQEVLGKVFDSLPGTPRSVVATTLDGVAREKHTQRIAALHGKRIQLLGYDTCRRAAVEFMTSAARAANGRELTNGFRLGTYTRHEPRLAHRRTGLLANGAQRRAANNDADDDDVRTRMLRSLDLHLAAKQRDYTARLMSS